MPVGNWARRAQRDLAPLNRISAQTGMSDGPGGITIHPARDISKSFAIAKLTRKTITITAGACYVGGVARTLDTSVAADYPKIAMGDIEQAADARLAVCWIRFTRLATPTAVLRFDKILPTLTEAQLATIEDWPLFSLDLSYDNTSILRAKQLWDGDIHISLLA